MGNDVNDLDCMEAAGVGVAVADALPQIIRSADYVTSRKGGEGAFREICELIFKDYEFGLGLVARQTGRRSYLLPAEAVEDSDRFLSDMVVNSYRNR